MLTRLWHHTIRVSHPSPSRPWGGCWLEQRMALPAVLPSRDQPPRASGPEGLSEPPTSKSPPTAATEVPVDSRDQSPLSAPNDSTRKWKDSSERKNAPRIKINFEAFFLPVGLRHEGTKSFGTSVTGVRGRVLRCKLNFLRFGSRLTHILRRKNWVPQAWSASLFVVKINSSQKSVAFSLYSDEMQTSFPPCNLSSCE